MLKFKNRPCRKMFFDNDDEFYRFCVVPELVVISPSTENGVYSTTFNFSKAYQNALDEGTIFVIKDEDSKIYKHGAVSYRTITKPVENLEQYFCEI